LDDLRLRNARAADPASVTVIGRSVIPDDGDRIGEVAETPGPPPPDALDGEGPTVLPGFVDTHVPIQPWQEP
jgi:imidazolonepropionase-like amidohydrolase